MLRKKTQKSNGKGVNYIVFGLDYITCVEWSDL